MPSFVEQDLHEDLANDPQSLEGRLLFAVPKSESFFHGEKIALTDNSQREDYYKLLSTCLKAQIYSSDAKTDSILRWSRIFP
jgi:hypothetical protein